MRLNLFPRNLFIGSTSPYRDVALTRAINGYLPKDGLPARSVFNDDAFNHVTLFQHIDRQGVEQEVNAVLLHHLEHQKTPPVRVNIRKAIPCPKIGFEMRQGVALLQQPVMCLFHEPSDDLLPARVKHPGIGKPRRTRNVHLTAQGAETLYQERVGADPGRCNSSSYTGSSTADNHDIILSKHLHLYT